MLAIILAGGQGTRLWPMSRKAKPKQFFDIVSKQPMIVDVYDRLRKSFNAEQILDYYYPEAKIKEIEDIKNAKGEFETF